LPDGEMEELSRILRKIEPGLGETEAEVEDEEERQARARLELLMTLSNLPPVTRNTCRFSTWEGRKRALGVCRDFLEDPEHHFLTLAGGPGLGKTHLALAMAWEWIEGRRSQALYYQVESFLDELRCRYRRWQADYEGWENDPYGLLDFAKRVPFLVLDDLGAEKGTEWAVAKLDELVDHRYLNRLKTVFTTNLRLEDLPPRIADRISSGIVLVLSGKSRRPVKGEVIHEATTCKSDVETRYEASQ